MHDQLCAAWHEDFLPQTAQERRQNGAVLFTPRMAQAGDAGGLRLQSQPAKVRKERMYRIGQHLEVSDLQRAILIGQRLGGAPQ